MKRNGIFIVIIGLLFVLLVFVINSAPKETNWEPDYTSVSTTPTGTYVMHDFLAEEFGTKLYDVYQPLYERLHAHSIHRTNYILINDQLPFDQQESEELIRFAHAGNTVFIAAAQLSGALADTFHLTLNDQVYISLAEELSVQQAMDSSRSPRVNLVHPSLHAEKDYTLHKVGENIVFTNFDTARAEILGTNAQGSVNFIRIREGDGYIYVHTLPGAYTNYHMTDSLTAPYAFRALSYLPMQNTWWDEYYKSGKRESGDPRRYILSQPALRIAYVILSAMALMALLFGLKRRQRAVPVVKPLGNTTLEFVEVVGTLYFRQGNHNDILHKKINYFLESIRTRFHVKTVTFDEAFIERIVNLSGVPGPRVAQLFKEIERIQFSHSNGETDLKLLEELINDFNKTSKR